MKKIIKESGIRDINKIFSSPMIKETIKEKFGSTIYTYIDDSIKKIANKGIQSQRQIQIINTSFSGL